MTRSQFFKHFELLADQPDAVAKMRRFILDLAVRGKLVAQDPGEEPAWQLLQRVEAEKERLVKAGEIKKQEKLPPVSYDAVTFSLPSGWTLTQLGDVAPCLDYKREPINSTERDLRIAGKKPSELFPYYGATQQQGFIDDYIFDEELVLLGEDGVPFFDDLRPKAYLISGKSWVNNHAHVFRGILVSNRFLTHWLNTFNYTGRVAGSTRAKLNQSKALDIPIALPPLAEQWRIVAKVDELIALCDELEQRQQARQHARGQLTQSAYYHLTTAKDPAAFRRHSSFCILHSALLFDDVPQLRQAILQLAVQGRLVPQNPKDENGELIVARIKKARPTDASGGELDRSTPLRQIQDQEKPFPLPTSWVWTRLGEVAGIKHGFAFKSELFTSEPTPFVLTTPGNFYEKGGFRDRGPKTKYYRGKAPPEFILRSGDLLIPMTEQAAGLLGSPAFIPNDGKTYLHNQRLGKLTFYSESITPEFAFLFFNSVFFRGELAKTCTGMKVRHTSPRKVLRVPFPVCSLAEQKRIVVRVEELLRWCDTLEVQSHQTRTLGAHLLDSTLHHLLAA